MDSSSLRQYPQQKNMVQSRRPVFQKTELIFLFLLRMWGLDTKHRKAERESSTVKKKGIPSSCSDAAQPQGLGVSAHDTNF